MYAIEVTTRFTASHQLRLEGGGLEPLHGHTWRVTARIAAGMLDGMETVVDFHWVQEALEGICGPMEGKRLNDVEPFVAMFNPSAERVAEVIGGQMGRAIAGLPGGAGRGVRLVEVRVTEAVDCVGIWEG